MLSSVEEMMMCSTGRTFALFPGHTHKPSIRRQWLSRTWSWDRFGLGHEGQCKLTCNRPSVPPLGDGAQISLSHVSLAILQLEFFWHIPNAILASSATSLIDVGQHEWFLAHVPWSPWCGRWKACLGKGRLQRISVYFWNRNTTHVSSVDLGRTLQKLLAAFRTFQHQFSPDGNRNQCTHAAALSHPSWNATRTVVDVHARASTERMRRDTNLQFCTYTCTELPRIPLCCHFATCYSFPEKKSVPELNDQPM